MRRTEPATESMQASGPYGSGVGATVVVVLVAVVC